MGRRHGSFVRIEKIIDQGADAIRFNLVIFAEGYISTDLGAGHAFDTDALAAANALFAIPPFFDYRHAINVHRVDVSSTNPGARDPGICGGSGANPRTYFNASYCNYGQRDFLMADYDQAIRLANQHCPDWDGCLILVNAGVPGGSAKGKVAVCAKQGMSDYIGHEMGHVFGLAEEYVLSNTPWTLEPAEINATLETRLPIWISCGEISWCPARPCPPDGTERARNSRASSIRQLWPARSARSKEHTSTDAVFIVPPKTARCGRWPIRFAVYAPR